MAYTVGDFSGATQDLQSKLGNNLTSYLQATSDDDLYDKIKGTQDTLASAQNAITKAFENSPQLLSSGKVTIPYFITGEDRAKINRQRALNNTDVLGQVSNTLYSHGLSSSEDNIGKALQFNHHNDNGTQEYTKYALSGKNKDYIAQAGINYGFQKGDYSATSDNFTTSQIARQQAYLQNKGMIKASYKLQQVQEARQSQLKSIAGNNAQAWENSHPYTASDDAYEYRQRYMNWVTQNGQNATGFLKYGGNANALSANYISPSNAQAGANVILAGGSDIKATSLNATNTQKSASLAFDADPKELSSLLDKSKDFTDVDKYITGSDALQYQARIANVYGTDVSSVSKFLTTNRAKIAYLQKVTHENVEDILSGMLPKVNINGNGSPVTFKDLPTVRDDFGNIVVNRKGLLYIQQDKQLLKSFPDNLKNSNIPQQLKNGLLKIVQDGDNTFHFVTTRDHVSLTGTNGKVIRIQEDADYNGGHLPFALESAVFGFGSAIKDGLDKNISNIRYKQIQ